MTATAMIIGMLPMALGLGEGGEQGREEIGGERWLVALDVDVDVGVDVAGGLADTVRPAGTIGRGEQDRDVALAADLRDLFSVGSDDDRVNESAGRGGAPDPLDHGTAGDEAQDLARHTG